MESKELKQRIEAIIKYEEDNNTSSHIDFVAAVNIIRELEQLIEKRDKLATPADYMKELVKLHAAKIADQQAEITQLKAQLESFKVVKEGTITIVSVVIVLEMRKSTVRGSKYDNAAKAAIKAFLAIKTEEKK